MKVPAIRFDLFLNTAPPTLVLQPNVPTFTILAASPSYLEATGTKLSDLIGIGFLEAFPENPDDPHTKNVTSLRNSITTAVVEKRKTILPSQRYDIPIRGTAEFETRYWTATNSPVIDEQGEVAYVVHVTLDITAAYDMAKKEKLAYEIAEGQRRQLNQSFRQAPLAIGLLKGPEHIVEAANDMMLHLFKKEDNIINQPLAQVLPQSLLQKYQQVLQEVFATGKAFMGNEIPIPQQQANGLDERYFNTVFQPITSYTGDSDNILVIAVDVTREVVARKKLERVIQEKNEAQEQLQLAIDSAQMCTWFINTATLEIVDALRLNEFFGFYPDEKVSFDKYVQQIHPDYRDWVANAIKAAIEQHTPYDIEYPIIGYHDRQLRWVRATGRVYAKGDGQPGMFSGTLLDITARKQEEQRKNDFISMVSHELKTPLTSVKGYTQLLQLKTDDDSSEWEKTIISKVDRQLDKMQRMISGFLNMAALESGKMQLVKEAFNLSEIIREMTDDATATNPRHPIRLVSCDWLPVEADKDKIGQVITNLLSNAAKYSPQGSEITVICSQQDAFARLSVTDQGIGIDKENLSRLFERFYRVESEKMKSFSGFGIGLYLCAEIIERHGGRIWAESESGKGSTFSFILPLAAER